MTLRERISEQSPVKIQTLRQRVQSLYQQGGSNAQSDAVLSQAFEELAHALEELQAADQALRQQRDEWLNKQADLESGIANATKISSNTRRPRIW